MACLYAGCKRPELAGSSQWGLSGGVCEVHFKSARNDCLGGNDGAADPTPALHDDYARIYILLESDKKTVHEALAALARELGNLQGRAAYTPRSQDGAGPHNPAHIKLAAALEGYETYCWFPNCSDTFVAQLTSEAFHSYLERGLMAKDPGAGPAHGDFTHRIHWHVVARIITHGFSQYKRAGWNHTPLDLFTSLGKDVARSRNIWNQLFEQGSSYRHPDTFNAHIIGGPYGVLSTNVARRFDKRTRDFNKHFDREIFDQYRKSNQGAEQRTSDGKWRSLHAAYKFNALAAANEAYAVRARGKYAALNPDKTAVLRRADAAEGGLTIEQRIAMSYASFARHLPHEELTHDPALGMLRRSGQVDASAEAELYDL